MAITYKTAVSIAAGASVSSALNLSRIVSDEGVVLQYPDCIGLYIPSNWTTANITLQASEDGTNWSNIHDVEGNEYTLNITVGIFILLDSNAFEAFKYLRLRSGSAAVPITQTNAQSLVIKLREDDSEFNSVEG